MHDMPSGCRDLPIQIRHRKLQCRGERHPGVIWDVYKGDPSDALPDRDHEPYQSAEDEEDVYKKPYHDSGDGPFIMAQCTFWGFNDETKSYAGPLFKNLKFTESLKEAEIKFGPVAQFYEGPTKPYIWKIKDQACLTIHWSKSNKARVVTYWLITPGM